MADQHTPAAGLAALSFMLGRWRVEGHQDGIPVEGEAEARLVGGGHFLELRERTRAEGGEVYEDLTVYGFSLETRDLFVHHFAPPDHHARHPVLPIAGGGFNWVPKAMEGPWVRLIPGSPWRVEVWSLDAATPDAALRYHPLEGAEGAGPG